MKVFVLNRNGKPLMPCSPRKVRLLLKEKKAKVIRMEPFTIQLLFGSSGYKQDVSLGVDAGSRHIGMSATTEKEELFSGEVALRNDVTKRIADRLSARRTRRNRKTRYRAPRFNNRSKGNVWMAPTVMQKLNSHIQAVGLIHSFLPIRRITVEVAAFDTQKIKNPDVTGDEYQQGDQLGFWNVREYVLARDGHTCQHCKGKRGDRILNVHHIESRKTGGNAPSNLITLCETCHKEYHRGNVRLNIRRSKSLRDTAFMGIVRWAVYNRLKSMYNDVRLSYGYLTKNNRIKLKLTKTHCVDAFCIAGNLDAAISDECYYFRCVRRHNRSLHVFNPTKGGKRKPMIASYFLKGSRFTQYDKVICNGEKCFITGSSNGNASVKGIDNGKAAGIKSTITTNKLMLIYHKKGGMICDRKTIKKQMQYAD